MVYEKVGSGISIKSISVSLRARSLKDLKFYRELYYLES